MFEKIEKCPICNHTEIKNYMICKDHMLTGESFNITKCSNCSFLFTNPRPISNFIRKYYKSDKYISHTNEAKNITNSIYKIVRKITLKQKVKLINTVSRDKTILDFGCGTGEFLNACKKNKWKISGLEPDISAKKLATKLTKTKIVKDIKELNSIDQVSLITLWHVLEHLHDLNNSVEILKNKLSKNGKLIIAVPNYKSYDAKILKNDWAAYDVPRHLYHFSQETMKLLLKKHGMKIIKIIPMKFDSYYVSLLSEKYKNGKNNYMKSFINGYKSNVYAKSNNSNYSSLIYIAGK